jgi:hypothetical protein
MVVARIVAPDTKLATTLAAHPNARLGPRYRQGR